MLISTMTAQISTMFLMGVPYLKMLPCKLPRKTTVFFDGYKSSTNYGTHDKQYQDVEVISTSTCDLARDAFLSNLNNKSKFIVLLCENFTAFYTVYQVEADADADMVRTVMAQSSRAGRVRTTADT